MALNEDRVTFWFGCNMLRHAEMIRLSIMLLERVGEQYGWPDRFAIQRGG
jgi:hypothetical protein